VGLTAYNLYCIFQILRFVVSHGSEDENVVLFGCGTARTSREIQFGETCFLHLQKKPVKEHS
jgi:hypothetical protein